LSLQPCTAVTIAAAALQQALEAANGERAFVPGAATREVWTGFGDVASTPPSKFHASFRTMGSQARHAQRHTPPGC
jgi:hypothetical protein